MIISPTCRNNPHSVYDIAIIGYGPAGASAALTLVRANRSVLVFDSRDEKLDENRRIHGDLNVDGHYLASVKKSFRKQVEQYPLIVHQESVISIEKHDTELTVVTPLRSVQCRKVILATGLRHAIPAINGLEELYGVSVFHCAYCHGWEVRNQRWALLGSGDTAIGLALVMLAWTDQLTLFTNGVSNSGSKYLHLLGEAGVKIYEDRIAGLEGRRGRLEGVRLMSGNLIPADVLFVKPSVRQGTPLVRNMGCVDTLDELIPTRQMGQTRVSGVYAAGDCRLPLQQFSIASGDGVTVAMGVNNDIALGYFGSPGPP